MLHKNGRFQLDQVDFQSKQHYAKHRKGEKNSKPDKLRHDVGKENQATTNLISFTLPLYLLVLTNHPCLSHIHTMPHTSLGIKTSLEISAIEVLSALESVAHHMSVMPCCCFFKKMLWYIPLHCSLMHTHWVNKDHKFFFCRNPHKVIISITRWLSFMFPLFTVRRILINQKFQVEIKAVFWLDFFSF